MHRYVHSILFSKNCRERCENVHVLSRLLYFMSGKCNELDTSTSSNSKPVPQELIKTANLLFSQLETGFVWSACEHQFSRACQSSANECSTTFPPDRSLSGNCYASTHYSLDNSPFLKHRSNQPWGDTRFWWEIPFYV